MRTKNEGDRLLAVLVLISAPIVGLFITPTFSLEPIDLPKMFALVLLSSVILSVILTNSKQYFKTSNKSFLLVCGFFLVQMTVVLISQSSPKVQQFYGTSGRNTGFLTYLALIILALGSSLISNLKLVNRVAISLGFVGILNLFYGLLQLTGSDPIKWNNPYNHIISFLGNPDFASSFLGISGVALFALLLRSRVAQIYRLFIAITICLMVYVIYRSQAMQGFFVFAIGSALVIYLYLRSMRVSNISLIRKIFLLIVVVVGSIVILGTVKIGPLSDYLYKVSVRQRGFYWNAAIHMMNEKPFTGVGLDSYGDWYYKFRSVNAAKLSPTVISNAAHNVFLDMGATGGYVLFILNIIIILLGLISAFRVIKRESNFNWGFAAVLGAFVAFQAQSLISINQIGLAVWGWLFLGILVGYEKNSRASSNDPNLGGTAKKIRQGRVAKNGFALRTKIGILIGLILGLFIAYPPFMNDHNFRNALNSKQVQQVIDSAVKFPEDTNRTINAANILFQNNLKEQALILTNHVLKVNPRLINAWTLKYDLTSPGSAEHQEAISMLNSLNPKVSAIK